MVSLSELIRVVRRTKRIPVAYKVKSRRWLGEFEGRESRLKLQHEMLPSKSHGFVMSSCSGILSVGTRLVNCVSFLGRHLVGGISAFQLIFNGAAMVNGPCSVNCNGTWAYDFKSRLQW